jgi:hypothetical protein|tara:strand:- start:119 stop:832 length:714 start_codon:yes stop_codon:yes gene_type:complete
MGLKNGDLKHLVDNVFEVDSFQSKMGQDKDIVTISFSVHEREAAKDLMNFVEKGYPFVLDADVSTGEQSDGTYKVFVEIERNSKVPEQIEEMVYGVSKLAEIDNLRFRYYKGFESHDVTVENLTANIPLDDSSYEEVIQENKLNNYTNFFNKSMVDSVVIKENNIVITKKYAQPIKLEILDFGETNVTVSNISETVNVNDYPEILFLTKYIGDYNISKYGDKLVFENEDKALVLKRI